MVSFYVDPKQPMDETPPGWRARVEVTVQFADSKTAADFSPHEKRLHKNIYASVRSAFVVAFELFVVININ